MTVWKHDGRSWYRPFSGGRMTIRPSGGKYRLEVFYGDRARPGVVHVYASLAYAKRAGDEIAGAEPNPIRHLGWILGLAGGGAALGVGIWAVTRSGSSTTPTLAAALQAVEALPSDSLCVANNTVKAFQSAWNAAGNTPTLTVDGEWGSASAGAGASYDSNAPPVCSNFT